ncbi:methyltransferase family protein [Glutamicibacter sp. NPDC087344]|uniref:methyltransferase family protein n=1 Tax=Glutamicibacter sp. NPDC087344 TaxID=3363994 RepID=UPI003812730F
MSQYSVPKIPPPVLVAATLVAQRLITRNSRSIPVAKVASGAIATASVGLALWAETAFIAAKTSSNPMHPERTSVLIVSGANAVSRNPMYLGMVGVAFAHGVWHGSARALVPAVALALWLDMLQIPAEEAFLAQRFGPDYEHYRQAVPRWLAVPENLIWRVSHDRFRV